MIHAIRKEIEASILAHQEAEDWSGELDHTAHIHSHEGVHNWRRDDTPRIGILYAFLEREVENLGLDIMRLPPEAARAVDEFGDAASIDSLARAIAILRSYHPDVKLSKCAELHSSTTHHSMEAEQRARAEEDTIVRGGYVTTGPGYDHIEDSAWEEFQRDLSMCLSDLQNEEFLVLSHIGGYYFVQFAGQGSLGLRAEAISNTFIESSEAKLTANDCSAMAEMGWHPPSGSESDELQESTDWSPNFYIDSVNPVDSEFVAALAVRTLRTVFAIPHPNDLQYTGFANSGADIHCPRLRIERVEE